MCRPILFKYCAYSELCGMIKTFMGQRHNTKIFGYNIEGLDCKENKILSTFRGTLDIVHDIRK